MLRLPQSAIRTMEIVMQKIKVKLLRMLILLQSMIHQCKVEKRMEGLSHETLTFLQFAICIAKIRKWKRKGEDADKRIHHLLDF